MVNLVGTGKRLQQGDIGKAAKSIGIETSVLLAFIEVEAAGRGFDNKNRLKMLRETHIFYRELGAGAKRNTAVKLGLANSKWIRNYSSDSYPDLNKMMALDKNAALRSCSWALPQILGNNCKSAGFSSAEDMVRTMLQGEYEQLLAMVTLMKSFGMIPMLTGRDFTKPDSWRDAAKKYNGTAYEKNGYHTKLAAAYRKHKIGTSTPMTPAMSPVLRKGMKGEAVRNMQNDLSLLGYKFKAGIDGRYGPETEALVKVFQRDFNLRPLDGIAGNGTLTALSKAVKASKEDKSPPSPEWAQVGLLARIIAAIVGAFKK